MADNDGNSRPKTVFQDVFRRADKNDDGAISWEEFSSFFYDGVSTSEELKTLFHEIDTHNTNNIDVDELCEFFKKHLGPFAEIFKSLDDLGGAVTRSLVQCHQAYKTSSSTEQFSMRFLLREVLRQFGYLQHHLETASDKIEEDELSNRPPQSSASTEIESIGRGGRMIRKMKSYQQQTSTQGPQNVLENEVNRLADLIDRLESRVKFDIVEKEVVDGETEKPIQLLCRKFVFQSDAADEFKCQLQLYLMNAKEEKDCLRISVQIFPDQARCVLYEIWRNESVMNKHFMSTHFKTFQRQLVDILMQPEDFSRMALPASWWRE